MPLSVCAYCRQPATPTKEHLWPASLHRRLYAANQQTSSSFWLARLQREIPAEPQIRDVCARCNNVTLAELDSYICSLFDSTFANIVPRDSEVSFEYDYHLLKRWLLKMAYNSSRIHDSMDRFALQALLPYILGTDARLGRSVQLFAQLVYPEEISEREIDGERDVERLVLFEPTMHRVGHLVFRAHGIGEKVLRAIHLRSYSFFLAYWQPTGGAAEQEDFANVFMSRMRGTELLRASQSTARLRCFGMGAWESFRSSRNTRFASDTDV